MVFLSRSLRLGRTLTGWLGIGRPQFVSNTQIAVDEFMSYLEYLAGITIIAGVVALCFPSPVKRQEVQPPLEVRAPAETRRRR